MKDPILHSFRDVVITCRKCKTVERARMQYHPGQYYWHCETCGRKTKQSLRYASFKERQQ